MYSPDIDELKSLISLSLFCDVYSVACSFFAQIFCLSSPFSLCRVNDFCNTVVWLSTVNFRKRTDKFLTSPTLIGSYAEASPSGTQLGMIW
jgi:hypothetical protein